MRRIGHLLRLQVRQVPQAQCWCCRVVLPSSFTCSLGDLASFDFNRGRAQIQKEKERAMWHVVPVEN